jgi:DNA-binding transcriptional LysR family regulator
VELRALRCFVTVADCGSVTAAAHELHTAQPSVSRQLRRFEHELGLALFDRHEQRLVLSAAGRRFLPIARDLVTRGDLAREAAAALREGAIASITLSATGTTLTDVIAPFLATWGPTDPVPAVWEELPSEIYGSLERGADLAIGTQAPPRHLEHLHVAVLPVWAYVTPGDAWATRRHVTLPELVERRLLVLGPEQHARVALDRAVARRGLSLGSVIEFGTPEVAQAVAAAGRGVAVVSDDPRFDLVPVAVQEFGEESGEASGEESGDRLVIDLHAAWTPGHHAAATVRGLARRLQRFSRERYSAAPE